MQLGDFLTFQRGFDITKKEQRRGPYWVISSSGPSSTHAEARVDGPGVVIGRKGSLGGVYFSQTDYWPHDTTLWVKDFKGNDPLFTYYMLKTLGLERFDVGAANPTLNRNHLHLLPIAAPSQPVQRKIAAVLAAYDELIENNLRRIETLEEMAQAVYREWFVNFRFPGHEDVPLVDSPVGPIPDGWELSDLGASARWLSGGTPNTSESSYWGGGVPWITSGSLTSFLLDRSERTLTEQGVEAGSRIVPRDTLLFVVRGMSLATEFRHGIAEVPLAFGQDCKALIAHPPVHPLYLAHNVSSRSSEIQGMVEYAAHGTGKLSTDRLKALPILHPPGFVQEAFVDRVAPMRRLVTNLRGQVDNLRSTRDLLLPKLVSGVIDVSELEIETEWLAS